ncbi:MAG TPA: YidB family protein [Arsenicitalea sp.]|jgi:uncharacterized protein YidB (DUF937 family)|nr:YidB family protein [Arsenicitalea sp.]
MMALLGLLAVAGYQNRDKLGQMLGQATGGGQPQQPGSAGAAGGLGGILGGLGGAIGGGASSGGILSGGLGELVDRFKQNGQGETADSWVQTGPNKPIDAASLERAIGPDVMANLQQQTGLARDELLARLSEEVPKAVNDLTPEGRVPNEEEAGRLVQPNTTTI